MKKKTLATIAGVLVVGGAIASYASPYLTLREMRSAMLDQDADAFASNVDFPAVRESLRAQFATTMRDQLSSDENLKDNPFAGVGMMLGMSVANQLIDSIVTPTGVMRMMAHPGRASAAPSGDAPAQEDAGTSRSADYAVRYRNWSTVTVEGRRLDDEPIVFTFRRAGLWSWKLTGVTLPSTLLMAH
jgi:hypothetical protein